MWLYAAARRDVAGHPYDFHAPVHAAGDSARKQISKWLKIAPAAPVALDALCDDLNAEYREVRTLESSHP
jgi:hypothetical protein